MIEALITGAAVGIVGCISGSVVAGRRADAAASSTLAKRLDAIEQTVAAAPTDQFVKKSEFQAWAEGFASSTQEAINIQSQGLLQQIQGVEQARRLQEVQQQVRPSTDPEMAQQINGLYQRMDQIGRMIGNG